MKKSEVLDFIQSSPSPVTKREIARAFGLKGGNLRVALKQILKQLEAEGVIIKHPGGAFGVPDGLPAVCVIEICDIDIDGDVFAKPVEWDTALQGEPPRIELKPEKKGHPALGMGERVLARLKRLGGGEYEARSIRNLASEDNRVLGLLKEQRRGWMLIPADKKAKYEFEVDQQDLSGAQDGDLCMAEVKPARGARAKKARIVQIIGKMGDPKAISLISLHEKGLREAFPPNVIASTKDLEVPPLKGREDLRDIPLVTIDGADARDFDDAVFAEKLDDGSFHLIVAIADVAHYVRTGTALDDEAQKRGNSTYFPDRVVPMLPEALSNDLCSLRPKENRACMAVHLWIDTNGKLLKYKFVRGLMRSAARLVYEQVQAAIEGLSDDTTGPLLEPVIKPLYEAFDILDAARQRRGALELDLPERQILIDDNGNMTGVQKRKRLNAHKMIEEFMILANVAAARALEAKKAPCVYRVHERPSMDKLDSVREFVESFGISMPKGQVTNGEQINQVLARAAKLPYSHLISQVILRSQSQAVYLPENKGHFGLALTQYAHFTSPIRRYADLLVHRSLINAYGLGGGGLSDTEEATLSSICQHISSTERTSMEAERNATDRFTAAFLSERIGAEFTGTISGVTRFGLFVSLDESGADGLVPMRSLPGDDFYVHDEKAHALIGRKKKAIFRLGAPVTARIKEADGLSGSTVLELVGHKKGADIPGIAFKTSKKKENTRKTYTKLDKRRKKQHKAPRGISPQK